MEQIKAIKPSIWYAGTKLYYVRTQGEPEPDEQDAMGNYIDIMQDDLDYYKRQGFKAAWLHEGELHHLYVEMNEAPNSLPGVQLNNTAFFVDFRLMEIRQATNPHNVIPFTELADATKAIVRGVRAEHGPNCYMAGLDD